MIRIGVCTGAENAEAAKRAGFDYLELNVQTVEKMTDEEFIGTKEMLEKASIPVLAMNCMVPGSFCLCSEEGTGEEIKAYLKRAYSRAAELGVETIVFGSGGARKKPEGMDDETAYAYLEAFLRMAGPIAAQNHLRIAIEPLREQECNILHYVREAQELAARVGLDSVAALGDLYHMAQGGDTLESLDHGSGIIHAHIAETQKRTYPSAEDPCLDVYEAFFSHLAAAGYTGCVSVEAGCKDFECDGREAFELLSSIRDRAEKSIGYSKAESRK